VAGPAADAAAEAVIEPAAATPGNPDSIPVTEDPAEKPGATGCDPGPDSELENLLTDADRVPDLHHDAATVGADKKES
jgi:amidophosphoribosyltransferase